jgi:hypothetical protein
LAARAASASAARTAGGGDFLPRRQCAVRGRNPRPIFHSVPPRGAATERGGESQRRRVTLEAGGLGDGAVILAAGCSACLSLWPGRARGDALLELDDAEAPGPGLLPGGLGGLRLALHVFTVFHGAILLHRVTGRVGGAGRVGVGGPRRRGRGLPPPMSMRRPEAKPPTDFSQFPATRGGHPRGAVVRTGGELR